MIRFFFNFYYCNVIDYKTSSTGRILRAQGRWEATYRANGPDCSGTGAGRANWTNGARGMGAEEGCKTKATGRKLPGEGAKDEDAGEMRGLRGGGGGGRALIQKGDSAGATIGEANGESIKLK